MRISIFGLGLVVSCTRRLGAQMRPLLGSVSLLLLSGCYSYFAEFRSPSVQDHFEHLARAAEAKPGGAKEAMAYANALEWAFEVPPRGSDDRAGDLEKSHARRAAAVLTAAAAVPDAPRQLELLEEAARIQNDADLFKDALATRLNLLRMIPTDDLDSTDVYSADSPAPGTYWTYLNNLGDAAGLAVKVRGLAAGIALS